MLRKLMCIRRIDLQFNECSRGISRHTYHIIHLWKKYHFTKVQFTKIFRAGWCGWLGISLLIGCGPNGTRSRPVICNRGRKHITSAIPMRLPISQQSGSLKFRLPQHKPKTRKKRVMCWISGGGKSWGGGLRVPRSWASVHLPSGIKNLTTIFHAWVFVEQNMYSIQTCQSFAYECIIVINSLEWDIRHIWRDICVIVSLNWAQMWCVRFAMHS